MAEITIRRAAALAFAGLIVAALVLGFASPGNPASAGNGMTGDTGYPDDGPGVSKVPLQAGSGPGNASGPGKPGGVEGAQDIYIRANSDGTYSTQAIAVRKGVPVRLHFTADPSAGCGRQLSIYGMGVKAFSRSGEESVVEFTPESAGEYEYNCGMRMWRPGKLTVS